MTVLADPSNDAPTVTVTRDPVETTSSPEDHSARVYYISNTDYFLGFFLPAVVCVVLIFPIRMIETSAKRFQPFHELTHPAGASAARSLVLRTDGVYGVVASIHSLLRGQALTLLTTALSISSVLLVPTSVEAVSLKVHGRCSKVNFNGCAMTLAVFLVPARVTMGILALMALLLVFTLLVLRGWRSGVAANPWSIAGIAVLSTNPEVRSLFASLPTGIVSGVGHKQLRHVLGDGMFKLGYFFNHHGQPQYGFMIHGGSRRRRLLEEEVGIEGRAAGPEEGKAYRALPFPMLSATGRVLFLLLLSGLLALILYYRNTGGDTPFERFMDTQSFGVRFLFTGLGVTINLVWSSFFMGKSTHCKKEE